MSSVAVIPPPKPDSDLEQKQISPSKSEGGKSTESGFSASSGSNNSGRSRSHIGIMVGSCGDQVRKVNLRHFGL